MVDMDLSFHRAFWGKRWQEKRCIMGVGVGVGTLEGSARTSGIWLAAGASSYPSYPRPSRFQQHAAIMRYVYTPYNIPNGKCSRNQHERYEHAGVSSITLQEGYLESVMVHRVKHAESFRKDSTQQAWLFSFLECRYPLKCTHVRYERDNDRSLVADSVFIIRAEFQRRDFIMRLTWLKCLQQGRASKSVLLPQPHPACSPTSVLCGAGSILKRGSSAGACSSRS